MHSVAKSTRCARRRGPHHNARRRRASIPMVPNVSRPNDAGSGTFARLISLASKTPVAAAKVAVCPRLWENAVKSSELTVPS